MFKNKKLWVILLSALLVVSIGTAIAVIAAPYPALTVSSHTLYYDAGTGDRQITVTVSLPEVPSYSIAGARFNIGYDPTVMTCNLNPSPNPDVTWNAPYDTKSAAINPVDEHLANLTLVWANGYNINYTNTNNATTLFVSVKFTVANDVPAGTYPITLSFVTGSYAGEIVNAELDSVATDLINGTLTINPIPITYTASITGLNGSGEAVYGTTIGASALSITDTRDAWVYTEADVDQFTYQWYRDMEPILGATNATYSPTADDIAATDIAGSGVLSVTIGTSGNFTSTPVSSSAVKAVRAAYTGTVPVPLMFSRTMTSITLGISDETLILSDCQFSTSASGPWTAESLFSGLSNLSTYTFYAQVKQTSTHEASAASAASTTIKPQLPVTGTLAVSDTSPAYGDTLNAVTEGLDADFITYGLDNAIYRWYRGSVATANVVGTTSSYTTVAADIGQTITLGISAVDDLSNPLWGYDGAVYSTATASVTKAENTAAPEASVIESNTYINDQGFVISLDPGQEYQVKQGGVVQSAWASYAGTTKQFNEANSAWLLPATGYVIETRFAATATHNTGTEIATTSVTSGKWLLSSFTLETVPASGWKYGTEITATGSTSSTDANATLTYQWYRDNVAIVGANTNTYTPVAADVATTLKVTLTVGASYEGGPSSVSGAVAKADGPGAPGAPELVIRTANSITITGIAGYQYKLDDGDWGTKVTATGTLAFNDLSPYTAYSIYARIAATDTQLESASSPALQATTLKQNLGGSVSISVSGGGDAEWGKTLTANTSSVTPAGAVPYLIYNWYSGTDLVQTGNTSFYVTLESDYGKGVYLVLGTQSSSAYSIGPAIQSSTVTILAKTISGTASITGLAADGAEWGSELTAVITGVTPADAQVNITYSWSVGATEKGTGSTYTPVSSDIGSALTLTLGGSGSYRGTVSTATTIVKQTITAKPTVSGSPTFGSTISADLTAIPVAAQTDIDYQWYRSTTELGTGIAIIGATSSDYVVASADIGNWIYVEVTVDSANTTYRGTTRSTAVEGGKEIITASIGITGTAKFGQELTITIGSLTPVGATYDVIWYRDGVQIKRGSGATLANTKYTLAEIDIGTVISATIIGTGNYTGTPPAAQTAAVTKADGPAQPAAPTAVSNTYNTITVTGITGYAYKLDSGSWGTTRASDGTFDLTGLSPNTAYSVYCYIPETATHFASVSSVATSVTTLKQPISGSVSITGTFTYGETLTANISNILPSGAQAGLTYSWYRGDTAGTTTELIGVTTSTLTLGASDVGKYIELLVTATGDYEGNRLQIGASPVAKANVSAPAAPTLNAKTYNTISINTVATNEYAKTQTLGGTLIWIGNTTLITYSGLSPNTTYYFYSRVMETATHNASDACLTPLTVTTDKQPIGGMVAITGNAIYGDTLTAVITGITPAGAQTHLTYQWYRVVAAVPEEISGATAQTYTIGASDVGLTIRVRVTASASSDYTGYVESADTDAVLKKTITGSISITGGAYFGDTLSVIITNVAPSGSQGTLTYQWQRYYTAPAGIPGANAIPATSFWYDIAGATNPTYTVTSADIGMSGGEPILLRVIVTGDGINFTGSLTSGSVTPDNKVIEGTISITGTARYGSTVTASASIIPSAAESEMSYRWFVDGVEVVGRTAVTFDIDDATWIGKTLTVEKYVSAVDSNYTGSVASAGRLIGKTVNPGTTVPVQVLSFDKTSITIRVTPGQIYSIDGGLTWTGPGFDGVFRGLIPGVSYTIITKIPGSETVDDSTPLSFTQQTQPDAVNVTYQFYNGITGTVIVPSRVEIGKQATVQVIAPNGYHLSEIFDSMPGGVKLIPIGNDTFTFTAGKNDIWLFIVFTADSTGGGAPTSSVTTSAVSSAPAVVSSRPSSVTSSAASPVSSQTSATGSDTDAPNMGQSGISGNAAGIVIALFSTLGIAAIVIAKRKIRS